MNALARYILVFLLGWSGAVLTYSDLISAKKEPPFSGTLTEQGVPLDEETGKPLIQTDDVSSNKELKPSRTPSGMPIQKGKESETPTP